MRTRGDCDANPPPRRVLSAKLNSRAPSSGAHLTFFRSADIFVESRGSDLLIARKPSQAHRKPHRRSNAFVTSQRITGIRAICYIPGVPTYHPALSRPCSGFQVRLRAIPGILPTPVSVQTTLPTRVPPFTPSAPGCRFVTLQSGARWHWRGAAGVIQR